MQKPPTPSEGDDARPGPHKAERTCVSCRQPGERDELVRLVRSPDGVLVIDDRGRLPGRGAWIHARRDCVGALVSRPGMVTRALDGEVDTTRLFETLRGKVLVALEHGLSQAAAAGALVGGFDALTAALTEGRVVDLIFAEDCSERTRRDLLEKAGSAAAVTVPLNRETLGARVGSAPRAAIGVLPTGAATHLRKQLHRLRALG